MRRLFPYLATLVVLLILAGVFFLRPTPFIGVTAAAMTRSLEGEVPAGESVSCEEAGEDAWSCTSAGTGYDVTVNGFGCWTAEPSSEVAQVAIPATLTGCITLRDH